MNLLRGLKVRLVSRPQFKHYNLSILCQDYIRIVSLGLAENVLLLTHGGLNTQFL